MSPVQSIAHSYSTAIRLKNSTATRITRPLHAVIMFPHRTPQAAHHPLKIARLPKERMSPALSLISESSIEQGVECLDLILNNERGVLRPRPICSVLTHSKLTITNSVTAVANDDLAAMRGWKQKEVGSVLPKIRNRLGWALHCLLPIAE